jgi:hypothetical protein
MAFALNLFLTACSAGAPTGPDASCEPMECGELCGLQDDGCGGMMNCGSCNNGCVPKTTCESNACGQRSDGCDGTLNCGLCPSGGDCVEGFCACTNDSSESNDSSDQATDLGIFKESSNATNWRSSLVLTAGDLDYFLIGSDDTISSGNPVFGVALDTSLAGQSIRLNTKLECHNGVPASFECHNAQATGEGCQLEVPSGGMEWIYVTYNCSGTTEDAQLTVDVSSLGASCTPYSLGYYVGKSVP